MREGGKGKKKKGTEDGQEKRAFVLF